MFLVELAIRRCLPEGGKSSGAALRKEKDENMRSQWFRAGVVALSCVVASAMICGQATAADLSEAQYIKKRVNAPRHVPKTGNVTRPSKTAHTATTTLGTPPAGFGSVFTWDRKDAEIIVVSYINAADNLGPAVMNLKAGDRVEVMEIDGLGSFSDGPVKAIESIIGLVGVGAALNGANVGSSGSSSGGSGSSSGGSGSSSGGSGSSSGGSGSSSGGSGSSSGLLAAANQFAENAFGGSLFKDVRDGYGHDTGGAMRRQEGGVLFCMPEANGVFYSGGFFDRDRWVQGDDGGERTDNRLPKHIRGKGGFFAIRGNKTQNVRYAKTDGVLNMVPWDFDFSDNSNFYRVFVRITRVDALNTTAKAPAPPNAGKPAPPSTAQKPLPQAFRPR
jgi:hypothetical protein